MARIRLKGLNSRRKALADGSLVTYYYAWKGGPRLAGELGSPEFIASYHEAVTAKKAAPIGVLLSLMQAYQGSAEFAGLRDRTRLDYVKQIKLIEGQFGDFPLAALGSRGTRAVFLAWRDELALKSRRQADYAWTVLARVLSWSKHRGLISDNPCERGGRSTGAAGTIMSGPLKTKPPSMGRGASASTPAGAHGPLDRPAMVALFGSNRARQALASRSQ